MNAREYDRYKDLLFHYYEPEVLVDSNDCSGGDAEVIKSYGGCLTCALGYPCRNRIENDIRVILLEAGLPETEKRTILEWLIQTHCNSLTHSISDMAKAFVAEDEYQKILNKFYRLEEFWDFENYEDIELEDGQWSRFKVFPSLEDMEWDVRRILAKSSLPGTEKPLLLQWLTQNRYSHLNRDIDDLAQQYRLDKHTALVALSEPKATTR